MTSRLPTTTFVRINEGPTVLGSFKDETWVVHLILDGIWSFQMEGRDYQVNSGDMVLLPPRLLHVVRQLGGDRRAQYVIHFQLHRDALPRVLPLVVTPPASRQAENLRSFKRIHQEWQSNPPYANMVAGGLLAQLLGAYLRWGELNPAPTHAPILAWKNIEDTLAYFQDNLARPAVTLRDVSRAAHLSPNYLCRLFRQTTGYSPMEYFTLLRLDKAEELLLHTVHNCTEIAKAVGYDDLHSFSRAYRRSRGISPSEFRRQMIH